MEEAFWHGRWQRNEISFHQPAPNPVLTNNLSALGLPEGARMFLPLCGKSLDIGWLLAHGYRVAGAELSRLAIEQLFDGLGVAPRIVEAGALTRFEAEGIDIFVGNIFDLDAAKLDAVDAVYDRAALVALPEAMRARYVAHLLAITGSAPQLLATFEYDQSCMDGPPFSVTEAEVRRHYAPSHDISCLDRHEVAGGLKGLCPATEVVWRLVPRERTGSNGAPQIA